MQQIYSKDKLLNFLSLIKEKRESHLVPPRELLLTGRQVKTEHFTTLPLRKSRQANWLQDLECISHHSKLLRKSKLAFYFSPFLHGEVEVWQSLLMTLPCNFFCDDAWWRPLLGSTCHFVSYLKICCRRSGDQVPLPLPSSKKILVSLPDCSRLKFHSLHI